MAAVLKMLLGRSKNLWNTGGTVIGTTSRAGRTGTHLVDIGLRIKETGSHGMIMRGKNHLIGADMQKRHIRGTPGTVGLKDQLMHLTRHPWPANTLLWVAMPLDTRTPARATTPRTVTTKATATIPPTATTLAMWVIPATAAT